MYKWPCVLELVIELKRVDTCGDSLFKCCLNCVLPYVANSSGSMLPSNVSYGATCAKAPCAKLSTSYEHQINGLLGICNVECWRRHYLLCRGISYWQTSNGVPLIRMCLWRCF